MEKYKKYGRQYNIIDVERYHDNSSVKSTLENLDDIRKTKKEIIELNLKLKECTENLARYEKIHFFHLSNLDEELKKLLEEILSDEENRKQHKTKEFHKYFPPTKKLSNRAEAVSVILSHK